MPNTLREIQNEHTSACRERVAAYKKEEERRRQEASQRIQINTAPYASYDGSASADSPSSHIASTKMHEASGKAVYDKIVSSAGATNCGGSKVGELMSCWSTASDYFDTFKSTQNLNSATSAKEKYATISSFSSKLGRFSLSRSPIANAFFQNSLSEINNIHLGVLDQLNVASAQIISMSLHSLSTPNTPSTLSTKDRFFESMQTAVVTYQQTRMLERALREEEKRQEQVRVAAQQQALEVQRRMNEQERLRQVEIVRQQQLAYEQQRQETLRQQQLEMERKLQRERWRAEERLEDERLEREREERSRQAIEAQNNFNNAMQQILRNATEQTLRRREQQQSQPSRSQPCPYKECGIP